MSDSQQNGPAPAWWSRPADAPEPGPRADTAGAPPVPASEPGPAAAPTTGSGLRYDPWAAAPLQVVDRGGTRRAPGLWTLTLLGTVIALLAGCAGGYLGILAERRTATRLELPQAAADDDKGRPPAAWPASRPPHCPAWSPCTSAGAAAAAPEPASSSTGRATS